MIEKENLVDIFEKYLETNNNVGEPFLGDIWIRSNKYYVFFGEDIRMGKTYAMFSKKYYMTVELTKQKEMKGFLDDLSEIVDKIRQKRDLEIHKYQFWMPSCLVNGTVVGTKLIAESYGVSRELALEYLIQYDDIFSKLFDRKKGLYFGLPLLSSYDETEKYILRDNTKEYLRGLRKLNKLLK